MISIFLFFCFSCTTTKITTDNILADTIWVVQEGDFSDSILSFYRDFTVKMTMRKIIDSGTYSINKNNFYLFKFEDGTGEEVHIQNNTFSLNGVKFILKSGNASDNLAMTVWWAESSTENNAFVLTCSEETFKVEPVFTTYGMYYPVPWTKIIVDFPEKDFPALKTTFFIMENAIIHGDIKFIKQ
jgi:hypothetical protein